jgi:hypothetical protein
MKSLLLTLMMLIISSSALASDFNIDGMWTGVDSRGQKMTFELKAEGKKLYGIKVDEGDYKTEIQKGKIKKDTINFEVPVTMGNYKMKVIYKGKILSDNEMELTTRTMARGPRSTGFGEGGGAGFNTGFGGGMGGFGGASQESPKFTLKRVIQK